MRGQECKWKKLGPLALPSGRIFVGDPTGGHDGHMNGAQAVGADALTAWAFQDRSTGENHIVWLEATDALPTHKGAQLDFGVDAGRGDSFDWLVPHLQISPNFSSWVKVPPAGLPMLLISTRADGGYAAVWLLDAQGTLCGILIDISGRASDQLFLDKLLPDA